MSTKLYEELKKKLEIDKLSLDDEIIGQPVFFNQISEAYAEAASVRDTLKEALTTIDAELDGAYRNYFEKNAIKSTEAVVRNSVQTDKKHEAAFKKFIEAKLEADLLMSLKEAYAQRSYMLRDLASLHVTGYFEQSSINSTAEDNTIKHRVARKKMAEARSKRNA